MKLSTIMEIQPMSIFHRGLLAILICLPGSAIVAQSGLEFINAWSPEAPPGRMMAGYVEIRNDSERRIVLTEATSPQFERAEFHATRMDDGMMRMRRLDRLELAPQATLRLESGSRHLMLIGPREQLSAGDRIEMTLVDSEGREYSFDLEVRARGH